MDIAKKIRLACANAGITEAELARQFGSTPSAFHQRISRGKFSIGEWERIAEILHAELTFTFTMQDGMTI